MTTDTKATIDFAAEITTIQAEIDAHHVRQLEIDPEYRRAIYRNDQAKAIELIAEYRAVTDLVAALEVRLMEVHVQQVEDQQAVARARAEELKEPFEACDRAYRVAAQAQGEAHERLTNAVNENERLTRHLDAMRTSLATMQSELNTKSVWK